MANTKISAFTSGAPAQSTDEFVIARAGANYKLANSDIKTFTIGAGSVSIASGKTLTGNSSLTLAGTDGKTLTVNNTLTLAGTDGTTMTFPSTSATIARTDAGNTFTGNQVVSSGSFGLSGNISTTAWTTNGVRYKNVAATLTDTSSTGTVAAAYTDVFGGNTIAASNATTFTDYFTTFINAPTNGANVTFTRSWALGLGGSLQIASASQLGWSTDLFLTRRGAANLRLGAADAAAPVAQTLSVQSVVAGTSNTAGANLTITGSQGTGTGAGGSLIFQVAPAGSSGTAQNGLVTFLEATSARAFNLYNTTDVTTNFERGKIAWSANVLQIGTEKAGTGTARALEFQTNGVTRLTIAATGPVNVSHTAGLVISNTGGNGFSTTGGGYIIFKSSGVLTLTDASDADFGRLQFGGTTSSFPALKRNSTALETKLADDSAYAPHAMQYLDVTDGITAPASATGRARIYVDTADGDLKVIFADGTVKTIVTDT